MRGIRLLLRVVLLLFFIGGVADGPPEAEAGAGEWVQKGPALNLDSTQDAFSPVLAAAPNGRVYVAWSEGRVPSEVHVKTWDGRRWQEVGTGMSLGQNRIAVGPSLAVAGSVLYAAWSESEPHGYAQLYVKAHPLAPGGEWNLIGSQAMNMDPLRHAMAPSLTAGPSAPAVAWVEWLPNGPFSIFVKAWNGTAWKPAGPEALPRALNVHGPAGSGAFPALAVSRRAGGLRYIVAWAESRGKEAAQLYVKAQDPAPGRGWERLGDTSLNLDSAHDAEEPVMAVDGEQTVIAWSEGPSLQGTQVAVKTWDGRQWTQIRPDPAHPPEADMPVIETSPALAIFDGVITLAWMEQDFPGRGPGRIRVAYWDGRRWTSLGAGPLNTSPDASAWTPSLAVSVGPKGMTPYAAWVECSPCRLYVKAYEPLPNRDPRRPLR